MSDHIGETTKLVCVHCGLPFAREQNNILSFGCGSSFEDTFRPQWARSMTCLEIQNGQLHDRIRRMKQAGDALAKSCNTFTCIEWTRVSENKPFSYIDWTAAKEAKP